MELSNVIMFICGMCPSLGSVVSQHVVSVTDSDTKICEYREMPMSSDMSSDKTAEELYIQQINWYKELQDRESGSKLTFHVSDAHLFRSSIETIRVNKRLLSDQRVVDIRSLYLEYVPTHEVCGISNTELNNFLCNEHTTRTLVKVCIFGGDADRSVPPLCIPSLRYLQLHNVKINNTNLDSNACHPLLTHMTSLRLLQLSDVILGDRGLNLSDMTSLKELKLEKLNLSDRGLNLPQMTSLRELVLKGVTLDDRGLNLSDMTSLRKLWLCSLNLGDGGLDLSCVTTLHELYLDSVYLGDRGLDLSDMTSLQELQLSYMNLGGKGLHLSANMAHIKEVKLKSLNMSAALWHQFIRCVLTIQHEFYLKLVNTNINYESRTMIQSELKYPYNEQHKSDIYVRMGQRWANI